MAAISRRVTRHAPRNRGKKSKLPPRIPSNKWLFRLSNLDFAGKRITESLGVASTNSARFIVLELDIHNEIRDIVSDYIADRRSRIPPKEFRKALRAFKKALDVFLNKFPDADSAVAEALDRELVQADDDQGPDIESIRHSLAALAAAVVSLNEAESGAGTDANREAHLLIEGLGNIYKKHTGKRPSGAVDGRFAQFVAAVNEQIPERFKLNGLEHLLRGMG